MPDAEKLYQQLCSHARETALLASTEAVLGWDERTMMPPAAPEYRAEQITLLSGLIHARRTDPRLGEWLAELAGSPLAADPHSDTGTVDPAAQARVRQAGQAAAVAGRRADANRVARAACLATSARATTISPRSGRSWKRRSSSSGRRPRHWAIPSHLTIRCSTISSRASRRPTSPACWPSLRDALVPLVAEIAASGRSPDVDILSRNYPLAEQDRFGARWRHGWVSTSRVAGWT